MLEGYKDAFGEEDANKNGMFKDSNYTWTYGSKDNGNIKTYKINENAPVGVGAAVSTNISKTNNSGFAFRTAESFLNSLGKKSSAQNSSIDLSKYEAGVRVYHKKFGEGIINKVEPEGEDLKVDINFDKAGHKRLMAKYANLEII